MSIVLQVFSRDDLDMYPMPNFITIKSIFFLNTKIYLKKNDKTKTNEKQVVSLHEKIKGTTRSVQFNLLRPFMSINFFLNEL